MNTALTLSSPGERIAVVEVLRAYALFGIIITHSVDGVPRGAAAVDGLHAFSPLDRAVAQLEHLFTFGKFYSIFSFLFGLSFAHPVAQRDAEGRGLLRPFCLAARSAGADRAVHGAFFAGDILIVYALLGLLLIPFRN